VDAIFPVVSYCDIIRIQYIIIIINIFVKRHRQSYRGAAVRAVISRLIWKCYDDN